MRCTRLAANTGRKKVAKNRHLVYYCINLLRIAAISYVVSARGSKPSEYRKQQYSFRADSRQLTVQLLA